MERKAREIIMNRKKNKKQRIFVKKQSTDYKRFSYLCTNLKKTFRY